MCRVCGMLKAIAACHLLRHFAVRTCRKCYPSCMFIFEVHATSRFVQVSLTVYHNIDVCKQVKLRWD